MKVELQEEEKELAINGYLMSLAVFITTMPIPVINLIANLIYFFSHRKQTYIIRWHAYNALLSQVPLFFINSLTWYFVWNVIWGEIPLNNLMFGYFAVAAFLNVGEIVSSVICCIRVGRNENVHIPLVSPIAHITCKKISWDKWERVWQPAEERFFRIAEEAKRLLMKDAVISAVGLAVLFGGFSLLHLKERLNFPENPMEPIFEKATYRSFKSNIIDDKQSVEPLKHIVDQLCEKNGMDSIKVYLVKKDEVNAFAYAGRNLAVFTGLIKECDNESQLASVLGHEMGHVEKRHVMRAAKNNLGLMIVFTAFFGDFADLATQLSTNHMSREMEDEADALSVEYLYNADVDPKGFPDFMEKIMTGTFFDRISFFSDHPATQDRVDDSLERIGKLAPKEYKTILSEREWNDFMDRVKKRY